MRRTRWILVGLAMMAGCGSDSQTGSAFSPYVGIYEITAHTLNREGCYVEGPDDYEGGYLVLFPDRTTGEGLMMVPCGSLAACRVAAGTVSGEGVFRILAHLPIIEAGGTLTGWQPASAAGSFNSPGIMVSKSGGQLRIEERSYPVSCNMDCSFKAVADAGVECTRYEVIRATFRTKP